MERMEQRFARHLCQKGYITQEEIDWCAYSLQKRFLTLVTTIIVLILGLLVSNWWQAFLFVCGVAFLRTYTNGYHAKTFWGCLVLSCAVTVLCLLAVPYVNTVIAAVLFLPSAGIIARFAPLNDSSIHLTKAEMGAMRKKVHLRLALLTCAFLLLLFINTQAAACLSLSIFAVAISIAAALKNTVVYH